MKTLGLSEWASLQDASAVAGWIVAIPGDGHGVHSALIFAAAFIADSEGCRSAPICRFQL